MAAYDIFLKNTHTDKIARLMIKNNIRLINYLSNTFFQTRRKLAVMEIGPGKGYFKEAIFRVGGGKYKYEYFAVDRNQNILNHLNIASDHTKVAELPDIVTDKKFDIIFAGYVIEHLTCGMALYQAISNLRSLLKDDGILVLQFPDSMKLGMEFYNIDYTHTFPTTKRNVNQAVLDNSMYVVKSIDLCGILYTKKVDSAGRYFVKSGIMHFYSYRILNVLAKVIYRVPIWNINNLFWRGYGLLKEPNVMFIIKNRKEGHS